VTTVKIYILFKRTSSIKNCLKKNAWSLKIFHLRYPIIQKCSYYDFFSLENLRSRGWSPIKEKVVSDTYRRLKRYDHCYMYCIYVLLDLQNHFLLHSVTFLRSSRASLRSCIRRRSRALIAKRCNCQEYKFSRCCRSR
jgi:hypothetical protein